MAIFHQSFISSWIYQSDIYMARFFLSFHLPQNFSSNFVKDITGISRISNFLIKCELFPNIWVWKEPCLTKKCWKNIFRVTTGYPKLGSAQKSENLSTVGFLCAVTKKCTIFLLDTTKEPLSIAFQNTPYFNESNNFSTFGGCPKFQNFQNFN